MTKGEQIINYLEHEIEKYEKSIELKQHLQICCQRTIQEIKRILEEPEKENEFLPPLEKEKE